MRHAAIRCSALLLFTVLLVPAPAFAAEQETYRAPPDFLQRMRKVKTIGILKPDMKIFEITSGGVKELRPEWCDEACGLVKNGVTAEFQRFGYELKAIDPGKDTEGEVRDMLALHEAVVAGILRHAYDGPGLFPAKKTNFDYTVGPIDNIVRLAGADALLVVSGVDEISTSGRKAMQTLGILAGAAVGIITSPNMGRTFLFVSLIDRSGDLLWFNVQGGAGKYNLREPDSVSRLVAQSLAGFQEKRK
jgi:hypothetical protein